MHYQASITRRPLPLWLFLLFSLFVSSCVSNKELVYFPNAKYNTKALTHIDNRSDSYKLQTRDVLSVKIKTLDAESSTYFNLQSENGNFNMNPASVYLNGYSIDKDGNIELPEAGAVKVAGLTVTEAQEKIKKEISAYLPRSSVIVKLVSFKITVLGEVQNPGYYYIYNDQATVLEGLGLAGDLNDFGNRENITLVRQTDNGLGAVLLNLKDPNLLSSEFYYLHPNDVLYIQPMKEKNTRSNLNALSAMSLLFGAISSGILLYNFIN